MVKKVALVVDMIYLSYEIGSVALCGESETVSEETVEQYRIRIEQLIQG